MTEFRYLQVFGDANDAVLRFIGIDAETAQSGSSYFTAETHIRHLKETKLGTRLRIETQVLDGAGKKLHLFHRLINVATDDCHATGEHILIHVSAGRPADPPPAVAARLKELLTAQAGLPRPDGAGRYVGQPR